MVRNVDKLQFKIKLLDYYPISFNLLNPPVQAWIVRITFLSKANDHLPGGLPRGLSTRQASHRAIGN